LEKILQQKRREVEALAQAEPAASLRDRAARLSRPLGFAGALRKAPAPAIIAEIKRGSPSKGVLRADLDPPQAALAFGENGACCLSVLTDEMFFMGKGEYIRDIKSAFQSADRAAVPVLRKDFIIDKLQVWESRLLGADALLLIVAALSEEAL